MTTVNSDPAHDRSDAIPASGTRTYVLLWLSQWFACAAVSFTVFIAGANVFTAFGSIWLVVLGYAINFVPFPIISPFAGAFVDRFGHRRALLIGNGGSLANLLVLALVMYADLWTPMYAMVVLGVSAIMRAFQLSAVESVVPLLIRKRNYARANGPRMLMTGTFVLAGPVLALVLLNVVSPIAIILWECALVALAIIMVLAIRIPAIPRPDGEAPAGSLRSDVAEAWSHLRSRRGLTTLVAYLVIVSGILGAIEVGASGALLGFADETGAIVVGLSCWSGMIVASIAMVARGLPRRLVSTMLGAGIVFAVTLCVAALRPNIVLMAVGGFLVMASLAVVIASFQTLMHLKVEPHRLGRVVGLKNSGVATAHIVGDVGSTLVGFAILTGGAANGVWGWAAGEGWQDVNSPFLSALIGTGPGRGWALFLMLMGIAVAAYVAFVAFRRPAFRRLEDDLPDVTPEDRQAARATPGTPAPDGVGEPALRGPTT